MKHHLVISPLCLDEFLHSFNWALRQKGLAKNKINILLKIFLQDIIKLPNMEIVNPSTNLNRQLIVIDYMKEFNLKPRDAYHLLIMIENKIKYLATFDKDFQKVFAKNKVADYIVASR